ncbi:hypothetical protein Bca52824_023469 [Brassica carinata]|uniref:Uncharacterized protein n=1 Tax=Brassica carinata TaxID=52824 RepID=A0A8X7VIL3_BRACI|nr:hypothetical protein Bca52824_023469 [Brassica carinata]
MRKICVVQPDEYGVYRDEDGNAHALDGRIINVSKEDIEAILEMTDKSGGKYLSLPQYEGYFLMPGVYCTPPRPPVSDTFSRVHVIELLDIYRAQGWMFEEFYRKIDEIYFSLNNSIGRAVVESRLHS